MTSPIEDLYKDIYGSVPAKPGVAFERLAAIAAFLLEGGVVRHDSHLRGQFSRTLYQLDVEHRSIEGATLKVGEAKDYSERRAKVGRPDLQKLAGALPDLAEIKAATFYSATGYTEPARKYAESAVSITGGKSITLYELAACTEADEQGTLKTVVMQLLVEMPQQHNAEWAPAFTSQANQKLKAHFLQEGRSEYKAQVQLSEFFDAGGKSISLHDLTYHVGYGRVHTEDNCAYGSYWLPGHFIKIDGALFEIHGLSYKVLHYFQTVEIRITDDRLSRFVLRDQKGQRLMFLTDDHLKKFTFDEDGKLVQANS